MFFRQHWVDPRLAYGSSLGIPKMRLLGNIVDQVWLPNTFFVNDLSDAKPSKDFLFELTEEGHITYSHRCLEIFLTKLFSHVFEKVDFLKTIPLASLANKLTVYCSAIKKILLSRFCLIMFRKSLRLYCPMDLRKFPMDQQICEMVFESCKYFNTYKILLFHIYIQNCHSNVVAILVVSTIVLRVLPGTRITHKRSSFPFL